MAKKQENTKRRVAALLYTPMAASLCTALTLGVIAAKAPNAAGD